MALSRDYPKVLPEKVRVLVVDDNESVCAAIAGLLKSRGYDTIAATSGLSALKYLEAEYFDVLLCDVKMPSMSGLEVLSEALRIASIRFRGDDGAPEGNESPRFNIKKSFGTPLIGGGSSCGGGWRYGC